MIGEEKWIGVKAKIDNVRSIGRSIRKLSATLDSGVEVGLRWLQ